VPTQRDTVRALLDRHGQTFAEELRIDVAKGTPSALFRLLCAAMLLSARIDARIATEAARGLAKRGWRTPRKLAQSTWEQRVKALNEAGYARYQERTATMLGDLTEHLLNRYNGDLRRLRDEAGRDPKAERRLLKEFKGVGDVGVDIFFREVQVAWDELFPFADRRALDAAGRLKLPKDARRLARHADGGDYPRLLAALVRVELDDDYAAVRAAARGEGAIA
jgi:endonuclease III